MENDHYGHTPKAPNAIEEADRLLKTERPKCKLCGEPMPEGEEMFNYHGYSGPCPKPPMTNRERLTQNQIDISNLRFYAAMARDFRWQTDILHYGVIAQTLSEIADRLANQDCSLNPTP